ncbi:hypothetical protein JTE90_016482 [Oedothorax gibbosus]|uniref:Hydrolase/acyltransferase n=1 Tax=Oedothorax gibbosus TaxID=931172 RepID=A0AAV6V4M7_9ARAC|nr:hypothetical protein JTE90_016482 [Oedothorax gibbosus]
MSSCTQDGSVYKICFKSCGNLYEKWRKEGRYRKLPRGDIEFSVKYSDTHKYENVCQSSPVPTVVALHGAPGTCKDYFSLSSYLKQNGVRVVVPTFPGKHSAEEKAQFVRDFLNTLSINQIDTLVVHSSTVYTGLQLCVENSPLVKSLVMLTPGIHTYDMNSTWSPFLMNVMVKSSEIPILYKILQVCGPPMLKLLRVPIRVDNYLEPLLSCTSMLRGKIPESKEKFLQLSKNKLPMLYVFSDDDTIVGKKGSYSLARLLGFSNKDVFIYDTNGNLKQIGQETPYIKVISFENGSHYVFWKYADIINQEIKNFIAKL